MEERLADKSAEAPKVAEDFLKEILREKVTETLEAMHWVKPD